MIKSIHRLVCLAMCLMLFMLPAHSAPQWKPAGPITIVVGYAAGGGADVSARIVADKMSQNLGVPVKVDNKPGGAATLAHRLVKAAEPNGLTLALTSPSPMGSGPIFESDAGYTVDDFQAVGTIYALPRAMFTGPALPKTNYAAVVAELKKNPKKYSAGGSINGVEQIMTESMKKIEGVDVNYAGYRGGAPALVDFLGGHTHIMFDLLPSMGSHIRTGAVNIMAVSWPTRLPEHPNVPTWSELGYPAEFSTGQWYGLIAPKGTPAATIDALNAALRHATNDPEVAQKIKAMGAHVRADTPAEMHKQITQEHARYQSIAKQLNISVK